MYTTEKRKPPSVVVSYLRVVDQGGGLVEWVGGWVWSNCTSINSEIQVSTKAEVRVISSE